MMVQQYGSFSHISPNRRRSSAFIYLFTSLIKRSVSVPTAGKTPKKFSTRDSTCKAWGGMVNPSAPLVEGWMEQKPERLMDVDEVQGALGGQTQEEPAHEPAGHDDVPLYEICGLTGQTQGHKLTVVWACFVFETLEGACESCTKKQHAGKHF